MNLWCDVIVLLSLFISKINGDMTPKFLYDVLSNRITVDGQLLRNEISDINSRIDTLVNTVNEFTGLIKTGNGMHGGKMSVVKPVEESVTMKLQKYEKVVNKGLADEKLFLRGEIKTLTEQMSTLIDTIEDNISKLTNENSVLRNKLDTVDDTISNLTSENIILRNELIAVNDNIYNLTTENIALRNGLITVNGNIYNLTSENRVMNNTLDILEESMKIQFEQTGNSPKKEMESVKSIISASINVLKDKHVTDLKSTENRVLERISDLRRDLGSTNRQLSSIQSREEARKISFSARLMKEDLIDLPGKSKLILERIHRNDGDGYDGTAGIFTCPTSGVYFFVYFVMAVPTSNILIARTLNVLIKVNGKSYNQAMSESIFINQNVQGGSSLVIYLYKGDKVWLETYTGTQSVYSHFTTFTGIMLY